MKYIEIQADTKYNEKVKITVNKYDGYLYYSLDSENWTDVIDKEQLEVEKIYFSGALNDSLDWTIEGKYIVSGNISALLCWGNYNKDLQKNVDVISNLFKGSEVTSAKDLILFENDKYIIDCCYADLFKDCKHLKTAPTIRNKKICSSSLSGMFEGCIELVNIQDEFDFIFEGDSNCAAMFHGCESLLKAPRLLTKKLTPACYAGMFSDCTSLCEIPKIEAEEEAECCYIGMFNNCTCLYSDIIIKLAKNKVIL